MADKDELLFTKVEFEGVVSTPEEIEANLIIIKQEYAPTPMISDDVKAKMLEYIFRDEQTGGN